VDLTSNTLNVAKTSSMNLRSASDGQLLANVPVSSASFGLASDGSYLWQTSSAGLKAFSPAGLPLLDRSGNYAGAKIAAVPGEVRVALGPAGASNVELVPMGGGSPVTHAFSGTFHSWFRDGGRFLTTTGNVARIYSKDGASQQLI